jgi:hypothetical protein
VLRETVRRGCDAEKCETIQALAHFLGVHSQRASRIVHALGVRDRFSTRGRPRGAK